LTDRGGYEGQQLGHYRLISSIPTQVTPLIGREQDVLAVCALLRRPQVRCVTLTGTGGIGKTRLALQVGTELFSTFVDGVHFVSLAPIRNPSLVISTIAQALALKEAPNQTLLEQLKAFLYYKSLLLILDNFEQILEAAPLLGDLLAACPHLKILVTSRSVLHLRGEHQFLVHPLELPDLSALPSGEALAQYPAVALFLQRVQALSPEFQMTATNARAIAETCVRLDGLPLSLELAASRLKLFSPQALLKRLGKRLSVLTTGAQDAPERQQTLRQTIAWSYELLTEQEQRLFRSLCIFAGGCTLPVIEAVFGPTEKPGTSLMDTLISLLDQSLLQVQRLEGAEPRFVMLETIREYGQECLERCGELETMQRVHAQYYLALAEEAEIKLISSTQTQWMKQLEQEHDNLRAALRWFHDMHDAESAFRLIGAIWIFWLLDHVSEGYQWIIQALALYQEHTVVVSAWAKAKALYTASLLAHYRGDTVQQLAYGKAHLELTRAEGDARGIGIALNFLGHLALEAGDYATLTTLTQESLPLLRGQWDQWRLAEALYLSAYSYHWLGDLGQARTLAEESLSLFRQIGEPHLTMRALHALTCIGGDIAVISSAYKEICQRAIKSENITTIVTCLLGIGGTLAVQGQFVPAVRLWGKAKVLYDSVNRTISELEAYAWLALALRIHLDHDQLAMTVRTQLDEQSFTTAWNEGQAMTLEQLLDSPTTDVLPQQSPAMPITPLSMQAISPPVKLTPREHDVLRLVVQGLTNTQIAEQLVITKRTVNWYLTSIYSKLGVSSRLAAAQYARAHHLLD